MEIIVQTLPYEIFNEAEKINQLFELGLSVLNIRKPSYSKAELVQLLDEIKEEYHDKIIIHSHFGLLKKYKLKGIHVSAKKLKNILSRYRYKRLKKKYGISISTSLVAFKVEIDKFDFLDFVVLGPMFQKFSEDCVIQKVNLFEVKKDIDLSKIKVYASGCFTISNIKKVNASGFKGIVLQSFIWKSPDINENYKSLILSIDSRGEELKTIAV